MSTDDNRPIMVEWGTATRREEDFEQALEPMDLMPATVAAAGNDCAAPAVLQGLQYIAGPTGRGQPLTRYCMGVVSLRGGGVLVDTPAGRRAISISRNPVLIESMQGHELVEKMVRIQADALQFIL